MPWEPALLVGALIVTQLQPGAVAPGTAETTPTCGSEASIVFSSEMDVGVVLMSVTEKAMAAMDAASDASERRLASAYDASAGDWEFAE